MKVLYASLFILLGCRSTSSPPPSPPPGELVVCPAVIDPHLCLIDIDDQTYAAQDSNKCTTLQKLKKTLQDAGHNPLIVVKATCGRVFPRTYN